MEAEKAVVKYTLSIIRMMSIKHLPERRYYGVVEVYSMQGHILSSPRQETQATRKTHVRCQQVAPTLTAKWSLKGERGALALWADKQLRWSNLRWS